MLRHRWDNHPRGSGMRRGAPGISRAHAAAEMQVTATPVSITIKRALCGNPSVPRAPIWQPLVGGGRTGNPLNPRRGPPHPRLYFEALFVLHNCSFERVASEYVIFRLFLAHKLGSLTILGMKTTFIFSCIIIESYFNRILVSPDETKASERTGQRVDKQLLNSPPLW